MDLTDFESMWRVVSSRWRSRLCQALIGIHRLWNVIWMVIWIPGGPLIFSKPSPGGRSRNLRESLGWLPWLISMWICSTFDHILSDHFVHQLSDESLPGALLKFRGRTSPEVPWECFHFKCFFFKIIFNYSMYLLRNLQDNYTTYIYLYYITIYIYIIYNYIYIYISYTIIYIYIQL